MLRKKRNNTAAEMAANSKGMFFSNRAVAPKNSGDRLQGALLLRSLPCPDFQAGRLNERDGFSIKKARKLCQWHVTLQSLSKTRMPREVAILLKPFLPENLGVDEVGVVNWNAYHKVLPITCDASERLKQAIETSSHIN